MLNVGISVLSLLLIISSRGTKYKDKTHPHPHKDITHRMQRLVIRSKHRLTINTCSYPEVYSSKQEQLQRQMHVDVEAQCLMTSDGRNIVRGVAIFFGLFLTGCLVLSVSSWMNPDLDPHATG